MTTAQTPATPLVNYLRTLHQPGWQVLAFTLAYAAIMAAIGDLRPEHVIVCGLGLAGWAASRKTRDIVREALPLIPLAIGVDSLRYLRPLFVTPDRVHGCDLRALELALFGVGPDTTLPDYFATRHAPAFDLFFAIPYGAFIWVTIAFGFMLYFRNIARLRVMAWALVALYLTAFAFWLAAPSAPPWYIQAHGCVIDPNVPPNAAALTRVDDLLGVQFFRSFYGRGATVFGAMPSVHNALAMLGCLVIWPIAGWKERLANALYVVWMICGSVYLDHHWLVDGFMGWAVAAMAVAFGDYWTNRRRGATIAPV